MELVSLWCVVSVCVYYSLSISASLDFSNLSEVEVNVYLIITQHLAQIPNQVEVAELQTD